MTSCWEVTSLRPVCRGVCGDPLRLALPDLHHEDVLLLLVHVVDDSEAVADDIVEHLDAKYISARLAGRALLHPGEQLLGDRLLVDGIQALEVSFRRGADEDSPRQAERRP